MLESYADETGHPNDPHKKFVGIGALLASSDAWKKFDAEWGEMCLEEEIEEPFHMTDFAGNREQFDQAKWHDAQRRERVLNRLLNTIEQAGAMPVGAVVSLDDFNSLSDDQRSRLRGPYYVVFQACTYNLAFAAAVSAPQPGPVSMTYAKLRKFTGPAEALWSEIKRANLVGVWMSSYRIEEPVRCRALQAADIWAYELGHHFEYVLPEGKTAHASFRRLISMASKPAFGHKFFELFDRQHLLEVLGEV